MLHTVFHLVVSEEMNTYIPGGGHFEFYAKWPTEIDPNLFAMVLETFTPIPNTMPNLKNLAPSARFDVYLVYSCLAIMKGRQLLLWEESKSLDFRKKSLDTTLVYSQH